MHFLKTCGWFGENIQDFQTLIHLTHLTNLKYVDLVWNLCTLNLIFLRWVTIWFLRRLNSLGRFGVH